MSWGKLSNSWSRVGIRDGGIDDMVALSAWKCGSHLYRPQKFEVYLYPIRSEHEAKKMARANQRLRIGSALSLGVVNVVADILNRKAHCNFLPTIRFSREESITRVLPDSSLYNITLTPTLRSEIIATQKHDKGMKHIQRRVQEGDPKVASFHEDTEGTLWFKNWLVVPKREALKKKILDEAHASRYSIHPGSTMMYHDLQQQFQWTRMKQEIARYMLECDTCRKVKADYMKPGGLLQPLNILDWKWDDISMDFFVGLPMTACKFDSIWVIVDQFTKSTHFTPVNTCYDDQKYAEIYVTRVLWLYGVPKTIITDWGSQFIARFWEQLHAFLGTHLNHSSSYHPQTDSQTERVNQILEDMLQACVMEYPGSWDKNLPWAEFSYNNSYQESLKMAPFEALYGCRCRTPLNWIEPREKAIFGPNHVETAKATISRIQENLREARSCQESYANKRSWPLEFSVGDHVYLKVSPMKGMKSFGMKGKLAPRYIGPFPILEKCGNVAHKLELPSLMAGVHNIFHVSQLKKCLKAPVDVLLPEVAPLVADLTYPKYLVMILDQKNRVTRCKSIMFFKVQWSNHTEEEATWESEDFLFSRHSNFTLPN
jgi:hypothetical protein